MLFLADMGVSLKVVEWLRASGHDAVHLRDQGLQRMPNGDIFRKAAAEQRVVLTFDLDFGDIAAHCSENSSGVVLSACVTHEQATSSSAWELCLPTVRRN